MVDMGVEPFLIAASTIGVCAQRLGRKICQNCKEPYQPPMDAMKRVGFPLEDIDEIVFYRGRGCEQCRHTGYKGRMGVYELMLMNEEIEDLIVKRAPLSEIKNAALASGMKSLKMDGFDKVKTGLTTIEEVMRVVFTAGGH
jgi:type IV pilus assembly protein PilB